MHTEGRLRVLYVGDHAGTTGAAADLLGVAGFDARVCRDPPSALAAAREFRPDVCLLAATTRAADELAARLRNQAGGGRALLIVAVAAPGGAAGNQTNPAGFCLRLVPPADPDHYLRVAGDVSRVLGEGTTSAG